MRNGPSVQVNGLKHKMGFILWLELGYADCLEGYIWANESTTEITFDNLRFEIDKRPDAGSL